jgi:hypothetical protein
MIIILAFLLLNINSITYSGTLKNFNSAAINDTTWIQDNTWYQWKRFNNLFVFKDSLYCTYSLNVFETNLLIMRDSIHYYQWFPISNSPFIKIFPGDSVIEAWTSNGYMRTYDLESWEKFPNPDNDLSWCAVHWNNYTVWGLEEFGRAGVIYTNESEYIFEEIVPGVEVYALGTNDKGYLFAALENNIIFKKYDFHSNWQEHRVLPYNSGKIRLIKFYNNNEYIGSNKLYLNGKEIMDCLPSSLLDINGVFYLSTYDKGMFISYDGIEFTQWNDGIKDYNIWSIISFNNFIYAATREGIFKRKLVD